MSVDLIKVQEFARIEAQKQRDSRTPDEKDHDRLIRLAKEVAYLNVCTFVQGLLNPLTKETDEESDSRMDHA